jgi:hypothetical protein
MYHVWVAIEGYGWVILKRRKMFHNLLMNQQLMSWLQ